VAECTNVPKEVADKALAHRIANAVEAAYRRTDFFQRRRMLMNEWAEFLLTSGIGWPPMAVSGLAAFGR